MATTTTEASTGENSHSTHADSLFAFYLGYGQIWCISKVYCFSLVRPVLHPHTPHQTCTQFAQSTSMMATMPSPTRKNSDFSLFPLLFHFSCLVSLGLFCRRNSQKPFYFTRTLCHREASSILPQVSPKDSRSCVGTRITLREKQSFSRPHIFSPFPNRNHVAEGK